MRHKEHTDQSSTSVQHIDDNPRVLVTEWKNTEYQSCVSSGLHGATGGRRRCAKTNPSFLGSLQCVLCRVETVDDPIVKSPTSNLQ